MALAGAVSGLQLSYVDGVRGSDVEDRTLPADALDRRILPGNKGSWRAHMNALRTWVTLPSSTSGRLTREPSRIVERNISTALILEDDVDWDVRVKSQMQSFALASRIFVQPVTGRSHAISKVYTPEPGTTSTSEDLKPAKDRNVLPVRSAPAYDKPVVSPYGDAFDVLWLGHCGTEFPAHPPALSRQHEGFSGPGAGRPAQLPLLRVTAARDATVPAPRHLRPHPFANPDAMAEQFAAHTRVVHAASATACTLAYAVSQAGARRLLRQFALETFTTGWDLMLGAWCDGLYMERGGGRGRGAKGERTPVCLAVQPPLFSHYLDEAKGSDIQAQGGGYLHKTGSQYIRLSVRANLRRLVEGSEEKDLVDQWPDEDV